MGEIIRRWWFLGLILAAQSIPPYASRGYKLLDWGMVNAYILTHPIKTPFAEIYPVFQVLPLAVIALVFLSKGKATRVFSAYVTFSYGAIAFLQNISVSDRYGFAVCTANVITFLILACMWLWEAMFPKNEFVLQKHTVWTYWIALPAMVAFWGPVNPVTFRPDFNPVYIWTSRTGFSFCMVTPLYLALLILHFRRANQVLFVTTGFVAFIMSLGNVILEFVIYPAYWWIGILHIPLFITSLYGLVLSINEIATQSKKTLHPGQSFRT